MIMLVDSHCHLDLLDLAPHDNNLSAVIHHAWLANVKHILSVGLTPLQSQRVIEIAHLYPHVSASVGIHPTEKISSELSLEALILLGSDPKVIAIGETGLDFYRENDQQIKTLQTERFRCHIRAAKILKKPLIIHSRHAPQETIALLKEENADQVGGVMHCFTESWEMAAQAIALNFYISFSGIITFKNASLLQSLVKKVPVEKILIETDAPYLAPHPYRGKSNIPGYIIHTAEKVAELKQISLEEAARITTKNFFDCFTLADRSYYADTFER